MTFKVVTDSSCDLPTAAVAGLGIAVVPLTINFGRESYLDGLEMSRERFYRELPTRRPHPTTSAPSPGTFVREYERLIAAGTEEILSIHISSSLSSVLNSARLAAHEISRSPVTVFDSRQLSAGTGFMVLAAARAAVEGRSLAETITMLEDLAGRTYVFALLDTVEYLHRSGRINGFSYGVARALDIKPLLTMHDGKAASERVRTFRSGFGRLVEKLGAVGPLEQLAMVHTNSNERAEELLRLAESTLTLPAKPLTVSVTPVLGAHLGPGAVGFACVAAAG